METKREGIFSFISSVFYAGRTINKSACFANVKEKPQTGAHHLVIDFTVADNKTPHGFLVPVMLYLVPAITIFTILVSSNNFRKNLPVA